MKKNKRENGVTLIALVITIIVLLILAAVSIAAIVGEDGITTRAQDAAKKTEQAKIEEEKTFSEMSGDIDHLVEGEVKISKHLKEGDYVIYNTGSQEIVCRVLYGAKSKYGLQVISNEVVEDIVLNNTNTVEIAKNNYNNAIKTLNSATEKYLNLEFATDIRCVGSDPIEKNKEPNTKLLTNGVDTGIKDTDYNYLIDLDQMESLGIENINESYFLASRFAEYDSAYSGASEHALRYKIFYIDSDGAEDTMGILGVSHKSADGTISGRMNYSSAESGIRPVIYLKDNLNIENGDGKTPETAYRFTAE